MDATSLNAATVAKELVARSVSPLARRENSATALAMLAEEAAFDIDN